jgi:hypothetical protein
MTAPCRRSEKRCYVERWKVQSDRNGWRCSRKTTARNPQLTKLWTDHRRRSAKPRWAVAAELHPGTSRFRKTSFSLPATATAGGLCALHSGVTTMRLCAAQFSMSIESYARRGACAYSGIQIVITTEVRDLLFRGAGREADSSASLVMTISWGATLRRTY